MTQRYLETRSLSEWLCKPLLIEDYGVQTMPEVSPPKWHLAHTTWFFEQFVLARLIEGYKPFDPVYALLFNSYYHSVGPQLQRARRGTLSRPSVEEIYRYRRATDERVHSLLAAATPAQLAAIEPALVLGLHHEQQHQELLLTDIKHILGTNPLRPPYLRKGPTMLVPARAAPKTRVLSFASACVTIGAEGDGFAFDHERPAHTVLVDAYGIHSRAVNCGEYLEFVEAGGYRDPAHWLSEGWDQVRENGWEAPLYWEKQSARWWVYTLSGMKLINENEPVAHVSYFEADAFARWRGARLPTEAEWERAAGPVTAEANLADTRLFHPETPRAESPEFYGNCWEWTSSAYGPYPGFKPLAGSLGEYNGKFMCNQKVLRGGSCATGADHVRPTYRNYFAPEARWQFTGLRLATP